MLIKIVSRLFSSITTSIFDNFSIFTVSRLFSSITTSIFVNFFIIHNCFASIFVNFFILDVN